MENQIRSSDNKVLRLYKKCCQYPFGKWLFSKIFCHKAPYFATANPKIKTLRHNYCECVIKKRRSVENHIKTVHVIAICNGLEMSMGAVAEASIPKHLRWIPKGMTVDYTAKAGSDIRCVAEVKQEWKAGDLDVIVTAYDTNDVAVVKGIIHLWISEKPKKHSG
ncbi:hotdog fold domain-containing protein [Parashewanella tropica]|uniref:hotdog fold domain-containing protein n=1 Tax=Parashewanella tropica TaxID=2547970 RepID=UPI003CCC888F